MVDEIGVEGKALGRMISQDLHGSVNAAQPVKVLRWIESCVVMLLFFCLPFLFTCGLIVYVNAIQLSSFFDPIKVIRILNVVLITFFGIMLIYRLYLLARVLLADEEKLANSSKNRGDLQQYRYVVENEGDWQASQQANTLPNLEVYQSYLVLVPTFNESNIAKPLVDHLRRLRYPKGQLHIRFLVEDAEKDQYFDHLVKEIENSGKKLRDVTEADELEAIKKEKIALEALIQQAERYIYLSVEFKDITDEEKGQYRKELLTRLSKGREIQKTLQKYENDQLKLSYLSQLREKLEVAQSKTTSASELRSLKGRLGRVLSKIEKVRTDQDRRRKVEDQRQREKNAVLTRWLTLLQIVLFIFIASVLKRPFEAIAFVLLLPFMMPWDFSVNIVMRGRKAGFGERQSRAFQEDTPKAFHTTRLALWKAIKELPKEEQERFEIFNIDRTKIYQIGDERREEPQTKPRALNLGMKKALEQRGKDFYKYCVVYDAEDRPEEDQLIKAAERFYECHLNAEAKEQDAEAQRAGTYKSDVECLQAKLAYENLNDNWIITLFKAEYSTWYEFILKGLELDNAVIPLGGTSNHFRVQYLYELGFWDAYNVAEDCDLGMWVARSGKKVEILDSRTWETADGRVSPWIKQRSRWVKGYLQTYLVHMWYFMQFTSKERLPWYVKLKRFFSFHSTLLSGFLFPLINFYFWLLLMAYFSALVIFLVSNSGWARSILEFTRELYDYRVLPVGTGIFFIGNAIYLFTLLIGYYRHPKSGVSQWILMWFWLYWILMGVAAIKGLWEFTINRFHWEKSAHEVL